MLIGGFATLIVSILLIQGIRQVLRNQHCYCKQVGAELCQAQVKLDFTVEVGIEFGVEVEACHY